MGARTTKSQLVASGVGLSQFSEVPFGNVNYLGSGQKKSLIWTKEWYKKMQKLPKAGKRPGIRSQIDRKGWGNQGLKDSWFRVNRYESQRGKCINCIGIQIRVEDKILTPFKWESVQQEILFHLILKTSHFILERWINNTDQTSLSVVWTNDKTKKIKQKELSCLTCKLNSFLSLYWIVFEH